MAADDRNCPSVVVQGQELRDEHAALIEDVHVIDMAIELIRQFGGVQPAVKSVTHPIGQYQWFDAPTPRFKFMLAANHEYNARCAASRTPNMSVSIGGVARALVALLQEVDKEF
jgi:hypothetical protein